MRVLLSFLAVDRPAHKDVVRGLLDEADQDDDKVREDASRKEGR